MAMAMIVRAALTVPVDRSAFAMRSGDDICGGNATQPGNGLRSRVQ